MKTVLAVAVTVGLSGAALPATQTFFFHHSDTPVAVPGGTTMCFLDQTEPTALSPVAIQDHVARNSSASFPACIAPAFGSDTLLAAFAAVRLNLSAGQHGSHCLNFDVGVARVDSGGGMTSLGAITQNGVTLPEAAAGGTAGFAPFLFEFSLSDRLIHAGESIAVTASATDQCRTDRDVNLALDSADARTLVAFQCCVSAAEKCAATEISVAGAKAQAITSCFGKAVGKGFAVDPGCLSTAQTKFFTAFAKAEENPACPTTGSAGTIETKVDSFVADVVSQLAPTAGPSKCTAAKIAATGKDALGRVKCEAKAIRHGLPVDPNCLANIANKLSVGFAKADFKGGCLAPGGDAAAIEAKVDAFVDDLVTELQCPCASPSGAFLDAAASF